MSRPAETMIGLAHNLEATAEWRREKALEYPDDSRNLEAAELLDSLVLKCLDLHTDEQKQGAVGAFVQYYLSHEWDYRDGENLNDYLTGIGFHDWPSDPEDLCRDLLSGLDVGEPEVAS